MRTLIVRVRRKWSERYDRLNDRMGRPGRTGAQNTEDAIRLNEIRQFVLDIEALYELRGAEAVNGNGDRPRL